MNSGRHFLQIPGPTNVPERVQRAMARSAIDHRGPEFAQLTLSILERLAEVFATNGPVIAYPSSGTGAWEAALVNTLDPGDGVLMFETGQFAVQWSKLARKLGLVVDLVPGEWGSGVDADLVETRLREDANHAIKAVAMVHNEMPFVGLMPLIGGNVRVGLEVGWARQRRAVLGWRYSSQQHLPRRNYISRRLSKKQHF